MSSLRRRIAFMTTISVLLAATLATAPVAAASGDRHHGRDLYCRGGDIAPGEYATIVVTGDCAVRTGVVSVRGDVTLRSRSSLWTMLAYAQLQVHGNVVVGRGAALAAGCDIAQCLAAGAPSSPSTLAALAAPAVPKAATYDGSVVIDGDIRADEAGAMVLLAARVGGDVVIDGGGIGRRACLANGFMTTRSGLQARSGFELMFTLVGGSLRVRDTRSCELVVALSQVGRDLVETGNWTLNPDNVLTLNGIGRDLVCRHNTPAPLGVALNQVGRRSIGQCAIGG